MRLMLLFGIFRGIKKLVFICLIAIAAYFGYNYLDKHYPGLLRGKEEKLIVSRVVDGDTFVLSNKERVRLIGIDTPEKFESRKLDKDVLRSNKDKTAIQELGEKASQYVKNLVEGKIVTLKTDRYSSDRDKYNRLLRYIYLEDGTCLNAKIIQDGYANAYTKFQFEKEEEFKRLEKEARLNNRGLWKEGL
jgi:micrococcal nuclease